MGNQCCAATNVPEPGTTQQYNAETYEEGQNNTHTGDTKQPNVHAQIQIEDNVAEQVNEADENQQVVSDFVFKRQLESLKQAIEKAENLKVISENGLKLSNAISEVEFIVQLLSQSLNIPAYIRDFKTEVIGLYGDMQNFRAFHLRYTLDNSFFDCLHSISELTNFLKQVYNHHHKDNKYDFEAIFQSLYRGEQKQAFEDYKVQFNNVRSIYNRISGQNFSTLPNYLYITFNGKPGFNLWNELFPHHFECSNIYFSEKYAEHCGVSKQQILEIMSLLDNVNDQRVDIYQWINFVEDYASHLDEEGKISPSEIGVFTKEIQNKTKAMKVTPQKNEHGEYVFQSGIRYQGQLDDQNKRQGHGRLTDEEYQFEGEFKDDLPNGQGQENRKKVTYLGSFKNGLYHGEGVLKFPNGRQYKGSFVNHQFHGQGELIGDDGIIYNGEWKNGSLEQGKIIYHDGSYYQGQLNTFFKDGRGTLLVSKPIFTTAAGATHKVIEYIEGSWEKDAPVYGKIFNLLIESVCYDGEMNNWSISGKGKRIYIDGTYEGELLRDKKMNDGTLTYKNGDKYVGKWFEDQQVKGVYNYNKEKDHYYDGEWKNGVMEGHGKFSYSSGGFYVGQVKDGKRHGKGLYKYSNGNQYDGSWVDNNQEGEGTFIYAVGPNGEGGDMYRGQFKQGKFHGFGHYIYKKSGKQYLGFWEEDRWCGEGSFFTAEKTIKAGIWKDDKIVTQKDDADIIIDDKYKHMIINFNQNAAAPAAAH